MTRPVPQGYERLEGTGRDIVVHQRLAAGLREALASASNGTLYEWARSHPRARQLQGRLPVYAAPLPRDGPTVVVRHAQHGGLLAPVLRDLFLAPTRAPDELATSLILSQAGVPTPPVVAYAVYRAGPLVRRVDVMTVELPGADLGAALQAPPGTDDRQPLVAPVAALLGALTQAGAWHPDLNVKNILLVPDDAGELHPAVLDVDRVQFVPPGDPNLRDANYGRLLRSVTKWCRAVGTAFPDRVMTEIRERLVQDEAVHAAHRALAMDAYMP